MPFAMRTMLVMGMLCAVPGPVVAADVTPLEEVERGLRAFLPIACFAQEMRLLERSADAPWRTVAGLPFHS